MVGEKPRVTAGMCDIGLVLRRYSRSCLSGDGISRQSRIVFAGALVLARMVASWLGSLLGWLANIREFRSPILPSLNFTRVNSRARNHACLQRTTGRRLGETMLGPLRRFGVGARMQRPGEPVPKVGTLMLLIGPIQDAEQGETREANRGDVWCHGAVGCR